MKKLFTTLFATSLLFSGCTQTPQNQKIRVVTTISPLYSLTSNLITGVDNIELSNIVPPNTSIHSYALTPHTAKQIDEANLIIKNGLKLETFLENALSDSKATVVDTSNGVELRQFEEGYDPHIWLSPLNAKIQATNITTALINIDPQNTSIYQDNLNTLKNRLDDLNTEIKSGFQELKMQPYIVFHDAYHYFEQNFGIKAVAFLEEFPGKEPSAEYLTEVINIIENNNVKIMFTEPQFSPKLVQTLSDDYGLKVSELDPLGQSVSKDSYFELIKSNFNSFKQANQNL